MDVVGHAELRGCRQRLRVLFRPLEVVTGVLGSASVSDANRPYDIAPVSSVKCESPTHAENLIVRVRGENQHPLRRTATVVNSGRSDRLIGYLKCQRRIV